VVECTCDEPSPVDFRDPRIAGAGARYRSRKSRSHKNQRGHRTRDRQLHFARDSRGARSRRAMSHHPTGHAGRPPRFHQDHCPGTSGRAAADGGLRGAIGRDGDERGMFHHPGGRHCRDGPSHDDRRRASGGNRDWRDERIETRRHDESEDRELRDQLHRDDRGQAKAKCRVGQVVRERKRVHYRRQSAGAQSRGDHRQRHQRSARPAQRPRSGWQETEHRRRRCHRDQPIILRAGFSKPSGGPRSCSSSCSSRFTESSAS